GLADDAIEVQEERYVGLCHSHGVHLRPSFLAEPARPRRMLRPDIAGLCQPRACHVSCTPALPHRNATRYLDMNRRPVYITPWRDMRSAPAREELKHDSDVSHQARGRIGPLRCNGRTSLRCRG